MARRLTFPLLVAALCVGLFGCSSSARPYAAAVLGTANSPYAVPKTIDADYAGRVIAALEHVRGDALRDAAGRLGPLPEADRARLASIYTGTALTNQLAAFSAAAAGGPNASIRNPPGDERINVLLLISASPGEIVVRAGVDNSAVTRTRESNPQPWRLELLRATGAGDGDPTPWKFVYGAPEVAGLDESNADTSLSTWDEDAYGNAVAPSQSSTPTTVDVSAAAALGPLAVAGGAAVPTTPSAGAPAKKAPTSVNNPGPGIGGPSSAPPVTPSGTGPSTASTTTEDLAVSEAKVRAYAQQMFNGMALAQPVPGILLDGGADTRSPHRLDIGITPFSSKTQNAGPYGVATIGCVGSVNVDWGDGTHSIYNYADFEWATTPLSHVWYNAGTYTIAVVVTWTAAYTIGPYFGVTRTGTLDPVTTTGYYDRLTLTDSVSH